MSVAADTKFYPDNTTANVVGVIEGTDPVLKNEYIILGAHLDHWVCCRRCIPVRWTMFRVR